MNFLLSAKGGDITTWRASEDFAAAYRQGLLDLAASNHGAGSEAAFLNASSALESAAATHTEITAHLKALISGAATAGAPSGLQEIVTAFYSDLYRHFNCFRSAPAFYQLSMAFLQQVGAAVVTWAAAQTGLSREALPQLALIALGPAGRGEYSPFSPLQLLIVHGETTPSQQQPLDLFCRALHNGFEEAGLPVDAAVTPRAPLWRGTLDEWLQRFEDGLHPKRDDELINLCRLTDQYPLYPAGGLDSELKRFSSSVLCSSRTALTHLIERMASLSNGIGLMGRLKLERSGREQGMFRLLDHGLLPFSTALSALALLRNSPAVSNCERISDLLRRRELDVELAERMLMTWHTLQGLRLLGEHSLFPAEDPGRSLFLDPNGLSAEQRQALKETLESVAHIQRHVEITFSGMGE